MPSSRKRSLQPELEDARAREQHHEHHRQRREAAERQRRSARARADDRSDLSAGRA
jgi:hypothetical protein